MTYLRVVPHPLGVVIRRGQAERGELLIPNEECCGISYEKLKKIADTSRVVEVDAPVLVDCPLRPVA